MTASPSGFNKFLLFKIPSAFFCGVRINEISDSKCTVSVRKRWINKNPFGSVYFAVLAMAAEISTGALVIKHIQQSRTNFSMLVVSNRAKFFKKVTAKVNFVCIQGDMISEILQKAIDSGEGQTFWLTSIGYDENNQVVAEMEFEWSLKARK